MQDVLQAQKWTYPFPSKDRMSFLTLFHYPEHLNTTQLFCLFIDRCVLYSLIIFIPLHPYLHYGNKYNTSTFTEDLGLGFSLSGNISPSISSSNAKEVTDAYRRKILTYISDVKTLKIHNFKLKPHIFILGSNLQTLLFFYEEFQREPNVTIRRFFCKEIIIWPNPQFTQY